MNIEPRAIRQIGKYPVERFVAEGGMAWVFKITDPDLFDAPRALKLLKPGAAVGEEFQRFTAEAKILATIQHPNLIHVYDFGQDPATGCYFYTMDYIPGQTLAELRTDWLPGTAPTEPVRDPEATQLASSSLSQTPTRQTLQGVCEYFTGVLSALARLHRHRIIHRDIKPQNIFLTSDGIAILGDLGIAKGHEGAGAGITAAGQTPGTPLYMSPEHSLGEQVTERSDLFSVGLSMYRVLTGQTVYDHVAGIDSSNSNAVLKHLWQLHGSQAEFEFHFPDEIPEALREVIHTACHLDESERYRSANEMNEALREAMTQLTGPAEARAPKRKPAGQKKIISPALVAALVGLVLLALLVLGGYLGWYFLGGTSASATAKAMQAETKEMGDTVDGLITFMASIEEGAPPASLLEKAREDLADARSDASAGRQDVKDESYEIAQRMFSQAQSAYSEICEELTARFLAGAAETAAARARKAGKEVTASAERSASKGGSELAGMMTALEAGIPPVGCDRAKALETRIELSAAIEAKSVAIVEEEFGKPLPEAVASALSLADEKRADALSVKSRQREYKDVMEVADGFLASARRAKEQGDYLVALREAGQARSEFEKASEVGRAAAARNRAEKTLKQIESQGLSIGSLRLQQQSAGQQWSQGEYAAAAESYRALQIEAGELLLAAKKSIAVRAQATQARKDAEEAGAPRSSLDPGLRQFDDAEIALRSSEFSTAEAGYRKALDAFRKAYIIASGGTRGDEPPPSENPFEQVMREYEAAFEARDFNRLNAVWSMPTVMKLELRGLFQHCKQVRVFMELGEATRTGTNSARLSFDQQIIWKNCGKKTEIPRLSGEMVAYLTRRSDGEWQIKKIVSP